jgi:hypothetical protein
MRLFEPKWYRAQAKLDDTVDALAHYRLVGAKQRISPHPLFHPGFYLDQVPGLSKTQQCPLTHYLQVGWKQGRNPHPMISVSWLRRQVPDLGEAEPIQYLVSAGLDRVALSPLFHREFYKRIRTDLPAAAQKAPAEHFLASGWFDGQPIHPLFSATAYLLQNPAAKTYKYGPAAHFVQHDGSKGLSVSPAFDPEWYLRQQPGAGEKDPALHYADAGWQAGASPHPLFDVAWYQRQLGGQKLGISHLEHYLTVGWRQRKSPHPLFDLEWYLAAVKTTDGVHPYVHFLAVGDRSGHSAHPLFRPDLYLAWHADIAASGEPPHRHYATKGHREFRRPHPMFDPEHYAWHSPDPKGAAAGGLLHYLKSDPANRRHPHPLFDGEAQRLQSAAVQAGVDPLIDYSQFRRAPAAIIASSQWRKRSPRRISEPACASVQAREPPLISVLLPVYSSPKPHLARAIQSVREQTYQNWELVIVDDGSPELATFEFCRDEAARDPRIKVFRNEKNGGISAATNTALAQAAGDYVAMLDHDDVMRPAALDALTAAVLEADADAAYSDQAYMTDAGAWDGDFHKPDWSPTLLVGVMYIGHLLLVRRELANQVGGFDSKFDCAQDFEFMLRLAERTQRIVHVPTVLYDWRRTPGSIAHDASAKGAIEPIQAAAVNAHFARIGFPGEARPHERLPHRLRIVPAFNKELTSGALIVLGGCPDQERIDACLAIIARSGLSGRLEVLDNTGHTAVAELDELAAKSPERALVYWDAVAQPTSPQFLQYLLMHLSRDDAAFASLHTCTREGRVLQAGGLTIDGRVKPAMRGEGIGTDGHAGSVACDREVSAVLGPFIAARLDHVRSLGGLDRELGSPASAFTEISLRACASGLRNIAVAGCLGVLPPDTPLLPQVDEILIGQKHAGIFAMRDPYFIPAHET